MSEHATPLGRRYELTFTVWARDETAVRDLGDHMRHAPVPPRIGEDVGIIGVTVATVDMQPEPEILADHRADVRALRVVQ